MQERTTQRRNEAAESALKDIVWLISGTMQDSAIRRYREGEEELEGALLTELLDKNFSRLDPDNNGISREELTAALLHLTDYTVDEYTMLKLLAKYFDTIINLSDDEVDEETVITRTDAQVLHQFLVHAHLKLSELRRWIALSEDKGTENDIGPPPLSTHNSA